MKNKNLETENFKDKQINVEKIVTSIKTKIYLEDKGFFEKRISFMRKLHHEYMIPPLNERSFIFKVWPVNLLYIIFFRFIRKLYFLISINQRMAVSLMINEIESLHLAIGILLDKENKNNNDEKKN